MTTIANFNYSLEFFNNSIYNGFNYTIDEHTMQTISTLSLEVGAPNYVKTPIFQKNEGRAMSDPQTNNNDKSYNNKKRRNNKHLEISDSDWNAVQSFKATKIEHNEGIVGKIDLIRSSLNKLSDKNYESQKTTILDIIRELTESSTSIEEMLQVAGTLFEIASNNRFYSVLYANLYTEILNQFEVMREPFERNLAQFSELFETIEYVEPEVNYDKFCKNNKDNEKRKSLSAFFVNLMNNQVISSGIIYKITRNLVSKIYDCISLKDNKNVVDELAENIAILYKSDMYQGDTLGVRYEPIDNKTITEVITMIATSNVKEYQSLTKKTIFKFMDLLDM